MTTYTPRNLKKWASPQYYFGEEWSHMYIFLARTRDSDNLEESNFEAALKALGGESDTVKIIRDSHWACGWIEWLGIDESDAAALEKADDIADALADYPVLDENDYADREYRDFWANCKKAVQDYCHEHGLEYSDALTERVAQNSDEITSEYWPSEEEIEKAIQ